MGRERGKKAGGGGRGGEWTRGERAGRAGVSKSKCSPALLVPDHSTTC